MPGGIGGSSDQLEPLELAAHVFWGPDTKGISILVNRTQSDDSRGFRATACGIQFGRSGFTISGQGVALPHGGRSSEGGAHASISEAQQHICNRKLQQKL
jgi:hypothetical protein